MAASGNVSLRGPGSTAVDTRHRNDLRPQVRIHHSRGVRIFFSHAPSSDMRTVRTIRPRCHHIDVDAILHRHEFHEHCAYGWYPVLIMLGADAPATSAQRFRAPEFWHISYFLPILGARAHFGYRCAKSSHWLPVRRPTNTSCYANHPG